MATQTYNINTATINNYYNTQQEEYGDDLVLTWEVCKLDSDYEIATTFPHQIRKRSTKRIVCESLTRDGYVNCRLNRKTLGKHVVTATQFVPNDDPVHKTQVDHINRDPSDNRKENLRWVTPRFNMLNRINDPRQYFVDSLSTSAFAVPEFNGHQLDDDEASFWFDPIRQTFFVKVADDHYRSFTLDCSNRFHVRDYQGDQCAIPIRKLNAMC